MGSLRAEGLCRMILTQRVLCLEPLPWQLFPSLNNLLPWSQLPRELQTFQNPRLFLAGLFSVDH